MVFFPLLSLIYHQEQQRPVDLSELTAAVVSSKPSTCILDPIPIRLFKEVFPLIDTSILHLINLSLLTGYVPQTFKVHYLYYIIYILY